TPYVHLGADEVGLGGLEKTEDFKQAQATLGIRSVHDLYCKFITDMHAAVAARGKKIIVWEEAYNPGGPYPLPKRPCNNNTAFWLAIAEALRILGDEPKERLATLCRMHSYTYVGVRCARARGRLTPTNDFTIA
ncbi:MAG TPA: family 20 glycosylhydrolase, partial [Gammaproteobacteria bacterium]|nr:family 20 glycosylhydrolase [Gammaproteobacteria bacterium]